MMSSHLFNKIQYKYFARQLRQAVNRAPINKSCEWIVEVHRLGRIEYGEWIYTEKDRRDILALVQSQLNVDLLHDQFPEDTTRIIRANTFNEEKPRTLAVSHDFILVNSLNALHINQQTIEINEFQSLGLYINANSIETLEHSCIVLVENLSVMANLALLNFMPDNKILSNALWLYRGDIKTQQTTSMAYQFFRRFKGSQQLICFADFDPKGIEIALTSGADYFIAPTAQNIKTFQANGGDVDYFKQSESRNYIDKHLDDSSNITPLYRLMFEHRKTIKQEHMLAKALTLSIFKIN